MRQFLGWLLSIDSADEDVRRRGRNVVILALGLIIMATLSVPMVILQLRVGASVST